MLKQNVTITENMIRIFGERFGIPPSLRKFIPRLFEEEEIAVGVQNEENRFSVPDYPKEWLRKEYQRGLLNKTGEAGVYRLNDLYGMLDVFVVSRKEEYDARFTAEEKHELDDWYFETYFSRLIPDEHGRLTEDRVLPLADMEKLIREDPRQLYLNYCDCRSLTGECGKPTRTCLTYKNGPNSFVDRGLSTPVSKEEAVELVREADKKGLMHTTMSGGICNCCSDCCYLFRSQKKAGTCGLWPASSWIAAYDPSRCILCGRCIRRCWMQAFSFADDPASASGKKTQKELLFEEARCAGCGLCVNTCPEQALSLVPRPEPF